MSEELNLRQAAERLIYWCGRIERASSEEEENKCCAERDKLFAVFRKVDAERSPSRQSILEEAAKVADEYARLPPLFNHGTQPSRAEQAVMAAAVQIAAAIRSLSQSENAG